MTDIVEKLHLSNGELMAATELIDEAVDEIEQLRGALKKIVAELEESPPGVADPYVVSALKIAIRALKETK